MTLKFEPVADDAGARVYTNSGVRTLHTSRDLSEKLLPSTAALTRGDHDLEGPLGSELELPAPFYSGISAA